MLGNVLIDKLRFSLKIDGSFNPKEVFQILENIMSQHFRENNYTLSYDKCYFRLTFTPTLYLTDVKAMENKPILNLDMIEENTLLDLLTQIHNVMRDNAVVTWIDLAKNIVTEEQTLNYIKAMSKRQFKYPYKKNECTSKCVNTSLILSSVKRMDEVDCRNKNRQIELYSKIEEIRSKTKTPFVDDIWLSNEEIEQVPESNYNRETGRLMFYGKGGLNDLNLLRCEQRYKYTKNISRITRCLTDSKNTTKLTLSILIDLLGKGELYNKLDEFYTNELKKYVFYNDIEPKPDIKLNKNEQMVLDKISELDTDINEFEFLFSEIGYKKQFKHTTKKILYNATEKYYTELYSKLRIKP